MVPFVLLAMIFCHVLDDFWMQAAFLANGKQRSWWEKNAPDPKYCYDYIPCLIAHCFSWTFMIHLPVAWLYEFNMNHTFIISFIINLMIHAFVDDLKANRGKINLVTDQSIHIIQICVTFIILTWRYM